MNSNVKIIVINGPSGVGKTTVARKLCELHQDSICIHGDSIKEFIVNRNNIKIEKQLAYKIGAMLIKKYIESGYTFVVFEFVFEKNDYIQLVKNLLINMDIKVLTLWDELESIIKKAKKRKNPTLSITRVIECYNTMKVNIKDMDAEIIFHSNDIDSTINKIEEQLSRN